MRKKLLFAIIPLILSLGIVFPLQFTDALQKNDNEYELQVKYGSPTRLNIEEFDFEQISTTDLGNIDVLLLPSPSLPQPKAHNNLHIIFFQPDTRHLINHIDFKIFISKDGEEVYSSSGPVHTHDGQDTVSFYFLTEGKYQVKISVLGVDFVDVPVETALFSLIVGDVDDDQSVQTSESSKMPDITPQTKTKIPDWIRNTANWWSLTQITDQDFAKGLEYLIQEDIINVPQGTESEGESEAQIPSWLRKNAGWWSQGLLSDEEFLQSIQWLINNEFIKI